MTEDIGPKYQTKNNKYYESVMFTISLFIECILKITSNLEK